MNEKIKNILVKLEDSGNEAYVVGGFIRDYLLGRETFDVDICTSALPKETIEIFGLDGGSNTENYGSLKFKDSLYNYDITTFRREIKYENRKPVEFDYIKDVNEDILRRDFTINGLYMDKNGEVYDLVGGKNDIDNKIIRVIGNISDKFIEDPLRMLRAIRFSALLDFDIEKNVISFIKQNKQLLRTLSYTRKKEELDKIFKSPNKLKGINLIKKLELCDDLDISLNDDIKQCEDFLGIWAQIDYSDSYIFKKSDIDKINDIKKVLEYGTIDNVVLYEYGLYICIVAADILGIPRSIVSDEYKVMPIYSVKDIKVTGDDIINILNIEQGSIIKDILFDLEINILNNELDNDYEKIKEYLLLNWR